MLFIIRQFVEALGHVIRNWGLQRDHSQWGNSLSVLISFTLVTCHEDDYAGVGEEVCYIWVGKYIVTCTFNRSFLYLISF